MNNLQIFENEEFGQVRTVTIDGEPWFVGKDVAVALGYSNTKDAISSHVDEDDRKIIQRSENTTFEIPNRGMTIINESGLYALIFGSKLESAKRFKHWVTSEVLPALRKTGHYEMPGRSAYDTKATSVGEVVNLVRMQQKVMERRGCTAKDISEMMDAMFRQFGIQMPEIFLSAPGSEDTAEWNFSNMEEDETFEEYIEELKVAAWERKGRSMVTCRQFNDFCAGHGISARKFRKWLYQNGYIMASDNHGKINYSMTIWKDGGNTTERCIVFKEI